MRFLQRTYEHSNDGATSKNDTKLKPKIEERKRPETENIVIGYCAVFCERRIRMKVTRVCGANGNQKPIRAIREPSKLPLKDYGSG